MSETTVQKVTCFYCEAEVKYGDRCSCVAAQAVRVPKVMIWYVAKVKLDD